MTTKDTKELKASIKDMSDSILSGITIDAKGAGTSAPDAYEKHLPEGISTGIVKQVSEYNTDFVAASQHAFGVASVNAMKDASDIKSTHIDIPMGYKDNLHIKVSGAVELPNDKGTTYGDIETVLTVRSGANGAQSKIARSLVAEIATQGLKRD